MKQLALAIAAAASCAAAGPVFAQGALKPIEAVVVNPATRPVPVTDPALAAAVSALAAPAPVPYQETARFNQAERCSPLECKLTYPVVPAGKRLVVTHASAVFSGPLVNSYVYVELTDSTGLPALLLPAPVATTGGLYTASSPVTFYVEAGKAPVLRLSATNIGNISTPATASVIGHLVSAP